MQVAWIETFLTVVERGGFCAAADTLFRSQSRVSGHIASLELELGARLFDRRQRPVALTAAGEAFLNYATDAKASLDAGAVAVRAIEERRADRLALGVHAGTGATFLPPLLADLAKARRDLRVDVVEQSVDALDSGLLDSTFQVAIRPRIPRTGSRAINREALWCERMVAMIPADHRLARGAPPLLDDLLAEPIVTNNEAVALLNELGLEPHVGFVSDHSVTLVECVLRGLGIGFVNELAAPSTPIDGVLVAELAQPMERVVDVCWIGELAPHSPSHALVDAIRRAQVPTPMWRPKREQRLLRLIRSDDVMRGAAESSRQELGAGCASRS
jgi:DNA-binding transcriptional LysR family regulator